MCVCWGGGDIQDHIYLSLVDVFDVSFKVSQNKCLLKLVPCSVSTKVGLTDRGKKKEVEVP